MVDIGSSIDEIITPADLLHLLGISVDDSANITDGDIGYNLYSISNVDDEKKQALLDIGFEEIKDNIFMIDAAEIKTIDVLSHLTPVYQKQEAEKWTEIIDKLVAVNESRRVFKPTTKQLKIVIEWKNKLIQNEAEFKSFIIDMFMLFRESCKNNKNGFNVSETCQSHIFWTTIENLRTGCYAHDTEHWDADRHHAAIERSREALSGLFPNGSKKTSIHYIQAQLRLIDMGLEFLTSVESDLVG